LGAPKQTDVPKQLHVINMRRVPRSGSALDQRGETSFPRLVPTLLLDTCFACGCNSPEQLLPFAELLLFVQMRSLRTAVRKAV
jgi:hypothetical protein